MSQQRWEGLDSALGNPVPDDIAHKIKDVWKILDDTKANDKKLIDLKSEMCKKDISLIFTL